MEEKNLNKMEDFGKFIENQVNDIMGVKEISKSELRLMMFKRWFTILINILVKMMIAITIIPLSSGITRGLFSFVFILWILTPFTNKIIDLIWRILNGRE